MPTKLKTFLDKMGFAANDAVIDGLEVLFSNEEEADIALKVEVAVEIVKRIYFHSYPHVPKKYYIKLCEKCLKFIQTNSQSKTEKEFGERLLVELSRINSPSSGNVNIDYAFLAHCYNLLRLESIAKHGIIPSCKAQEYGFCLRSQDSKPSTSVSLNAVDLTVHAKKQRKTLKGSSHKSQAEQDIDDVMKYLVENESAGLHAIARERSYEAITRLNPSTAVETRPEALSERVLNSVLFVLNHPSLNPHYNMKSFSYYEVLTQGFGSDCIQVIWAPSHLISYLELLFPGKNIQQLEIQASNSLPDFERGLRDYITEYKPERFMVHLSRLATFEDMRFLLALDDSNEERLSAQAREVLWHKKNDIEEDAICDIARSGLVKNGINNDNVDLILTYFTTRISRTQGIKLPTSEQNPVENNYSNMLK